MPDVETSRLLRHAPDVVAQQAAGRRVLLNVRTGHYYAVEEVAARVWELWDGTRTLGQVVDVIVAEYDAPSDVVEQDVRTFTAELLAESLLL